MAHFAELDGNNIVQRVIVVSDKNTSDANGVEDENIGIAFCKKLYGEDTIWKQCSYNMKIRRAFPGNGYVYVESADVFARPQPHPSWSLDENAQWQPPIPEPSLTEEQIKLRYYYYWSEKLYQDDTNEPKTAGWVLFTPQVVTIDTQPTDATVSVGSSAVFTASATVNKGYFGYVLQKQDVDGEFFPIDETFASNELDNSLTLNATCYTGITTSGDNNTQYRIEFMPRESGILGFTTTVTLTVTE